MKSSTNWKIGKYFKNNAHSQEEEQRNASVGAGKTADWAKRTEGLGPAEKVRVLENELRARDEELKERNSTIRCLQDIHDGIGLRSSAPGLDTGSSIKDKACQQLVEGTRKLYRELEDFSKLVDSEDKSRYAPPPVPPPIAQKLARRSGNRDVPLFDQRVKSHSIKGLSATHEGNLRLAHIRYNWEEHNLKAAYDVLADQDQARSGVRTKAAMLADPITTSAVMKTHSAPLQEAKPETGLRSAVENRNVNQKQKNLLLSLVGDETDEESVSVSEKSDEAIDVYRVKPARAYSPVVGNKSMRTSVFDNAETPDWLDGAGEIRIVPVETVLLNSLHRKANALGVDGGAETKGSMEKEGKKSDWTGAFSAVQTKSSMIHARQVSSDQGSDID